MRLMLRPQFKFRLWPLSSFCGLLDLKTGVEIVLLFAVLNKVAGVYGLIAALTGAGGSFAQLSMYIYSVLGLIALGWGLQVVKAEDARQTLYLAHLFAADYVLSTSWTVYFAVRWWWYTPHDGARQANSQAQGDLIAVAQITGPMLTGEQRAEAARLIWDQEKGMAFGVIFVSWLCKIYFALLLYSYAIHLRKGSYRSLALTRSNPSRATANGAASAQSSSALAEDELDEEVEDFYRVPLRTPPPNARHATHPTSVSSFAEFVGADKAQNPTPSSHSTGGGLKALGDFNKFKTPADADDDDDDEVLFDTDEYPYTSSGSTSKAHSKRGTETSTSGSRSSVDNDDTFRKPEL